MAQVQAPSPTPAPPPVSSTAEGGDEVNLGPMCSLYVGDLDVNVTDSELFDHFSRVGNIISVRVCRDSDTQISLGYGYVNYSNKHEAARALHELNFTPLNGMAVRIMYSHSDPPVHLNGVGNVYVKNLDKSIDTKVLHDTFSQFGSILSCKIAADPFGQSKGYGFVLFDNEDSAKNAIDTLNGMLLNGKEVYVGPFLRKEERVPVANKTKFNNVYVKNLSVSTSDDDLKNTFGQYGNITSAVVMRDGDGKSRCFGFVNFENSDDAEQSVEALNGKKFGDKEWYVGKAQKKFEREMELRERFEHNLRETGGKSERLSLYVKHLDDYINDEKLREMFSEFGTITYCKVMRDSSGASRGSGFVAYSTAGEASRALMEMNGEMVGSKTLYVALAQRKEERRGRLQAQFTRPAIVPPVGPRMPIYPPGIAQQMFYGQGPPGLIHPQPRFGNQPQLVPGMRPNLFPPMHQMFPQGQRPGGRRSGGGPMRQSQHLIPLMQPQMFPRGRGPHYPPSRVAHGPVPVAYDMYGGFPFPQPMAAGALASALARATPAQQRMLLGERLFPLVNQLEHGNAAKITGMILELDQTEVLHLLESPEALRAKATEAMEVLRSSDQQPPQVRNVPTGQMASLSIN